MATPPAPVAANKSGVGVPYASTGTAIDLSASVTGVHSSIAIGTAPAHGTVTIAGDVVTYTPNPATYYGADSFTYTATGPGGTSAPATVSLTVATPAGTDRDGQERRGGVPYASTGTAIDLSASVTGVHSSIAIGTAPAHGTVTIAGDVVTYTPAATYYGAGQLHLHGDRPRRHFGPGDGDSDGGDARRAGRGEQERRGGALCEHRHGDRPVGLGHGRPFEHRGCDRSGTRHGERRGRMW